MKYIEYLRRLLTFQKYPLFRTVPFKQVLLNILIMGILLSIPALITQLNTTEAMDQLSKVQQDFPNFEIKDEEYHGEEKIIDNYGIKIKFTEDEKIDPDYDVMFLKNGIFINGFENNEIPYVNFKEINDDDALKEYVNQQSQNRVFFFIVYTTIQVFVLAAFSFILLLVLSFVLDFISKQLNKKSDYMNWLKVESFTFMIATLLYTVIQLLFHHSSFIIFIVTLPFLLFYFSKLPLQKRK